MCEIKILLLLFLSGICYVTGEKHILCYYGSWATYRHGYGKFDVDNINPDLCTHLIYSFAGINLSGEVISLDPYLDLPDNWGRNNFGRFNALKNKNPKLKTLLSVGGYNEGSAKYSLMAGDANKRKSFIKSAVNIIRKYGFDGLDICWEYPALRDTVHGIQDVDNYTQLLKELREAFDTYGLILTAAVSATRDMAALSYNVTNISKYLDLVNVMAYDMNLPWDGVTGHNSPLHRSEGDEMVPDLYLHTVDASLEYWLTEGCPPEKLVLGIPLYGHTYKLQDPKKNSVRDPTLGPGAAGEFTQTPGTMGYNEICVFLRDTNAPQQRDEKAKVPYAVKNYDWVSYDDIYSITEKVKYALSLDIAGIMVWSIESDDFHARCGREFSLLHAVNNAINDTVNSGVLSSIGINVLISPN